jgi:hypothetical protein
MNAKILKKRVGKIFRIVIEVSAPKTRLATIAIFAMTGKLAPAVRLQAVRIRVIGIGEHCVYCAFLRKHVEHLVGALIAPSKGLYLDSDKILSVDGRVGAPGPRCRRHSGT